MADGDHKEEKAFKYDCPLTVGLQQQSTRDLPSSAQNDRNRLRKEERLRAFLFFNEDRELSKRVQRETIGALMRAAGKIDELRRVRETHFLERNRGSDAIPGLRTVKLKWCCARHQGKVAAHVQDRASHPAAPQAGETS